MSSPPGTRSLQETSVAKILSPGQDLPMARRLHPHPSTEHLPFDVQD
jgi:hypothetical protein